MDAETGLAAAARWEAGCSVDPCRNEFVIPTLAALMEVRKPSRVLDVGAGTGFVARAVDRKLSYSATWTLTDCDPSRLAIARKHMPPKMNADLICQDAISFLTCPNINGFDSIVVCFTLLEFENYNLLLEAASRALVLGGQLLIVVPDPWQEAISDPVKAQLLLRERVSIDKVDKFTGLPYPFYITRNEALVADAQSNGLSLTATVKSSSLSVYIFEFSKLNLY
jgi:SAM-dependent methyltransferase